MAVGGRFTGTLTLDYPSANLWSQIRQLSQARSKQRTEYLPLRDYELDLDEAPLASLSDLIVER